MKTEEYKCPKCNSKRLLCLGGKDNIDVVRIDSFYCQIEAKCMDCDTLLKLTYKLDLDNVEILK